MLKPHYFLSARIKDPRDTHYDGQDSGEEIAYVYRKSMITNLAWFFATIVLLVIPLYLFPYLAQLSFEGRKILPATYIFILNLFWYLFVFGFFLQNFVIWFFNIYVITNKKIIDMDFHGLLYKNISETPIRNLEDVTSNVSGTLGVIFNVGDVFIQTSAEHTEFEFESVDDPAKLRDIISDLITAVKHD